MSYKPQPEDTTEINLDSSIMELAEQLARNTHEVWSAQRIKDGWTYGPEINTEKKQTPCLVPYEELLEPEKVLDRNTSMEALKFITKMGYKIVKETNINEKELTDRIIDARDKGRNDSESAGKILDKIRDVMSKSGGCSKNLWAILMTAYRDVNNWEGMIELYDDYLPGELRSTRQMQEKYALALNRRNKGDDRQKAEKMLLKLVKENAETCGILGRVYKDFYNEAKASGDADNYLNQAIKYYKLGFECDNDNYYAGINAVTLMIIEAKGKGRMHTDMLGTLLVRLSELMEEKPGDYWINATMLEARVLERKWAEANDMLWRLAKIKHQPWMIETTIDNLEEIRQAFNELGIECKSLSNIIANLEDLKGKRLV